MKALKEQAKPEEAADRHSGTLERRIRVRRSVDKVVFAVRVPLLMASCSVGPEFM